MTQQIYSKLTQYLTNECGLDAEKIMPEASLFLSGLLDSIEVIQLIVFLEKTFSIKINAFDVSLERLDSINKITEFLATKGIGACTLSD